MTGVNDLEAARDRYLRWGAQERAHAAYCSVTGRGGWRCWTYLGKQVEAASVASDMAVAAAYPPCDWRPARERLWLLRADDEIRSKVAWG